MVPSAPRRFLSLLRVTLYPPDGTPPSQVRRSGAVTLLFGLAGLVVSVGAASVLEGRFGVTPFTAAELTFPLWVIAFGGLLFGLFHLILARRPDTLGSVARIVLGVGFVFWTLVMLAIGLLASSLLVSVLSKPR